MRFLRRQRAREQREFFIVNRSLLSKIYGCTRDLVFLFIKITYSLIVNFVSYYALDVYAIIKIMKKDFAGRKKKLLDQLSISVTTLLNYSVKRAFSFTSPSTHFQEY